MIPAPPEVASHSFDAQRALRLAHETFEIEAEAGPGRNAQSTLARHADIVLDSGVAKEACPLNLAPTASTTAQLALGDALAVALLDARGFESDDFARSHPGGALGRKLLTHLSDVMRTGDDVPRVTAHTGFTELMREMSAKGLGASAVIDAQGKVL